MTTALACVIPALDAEATLPAVACGLRLALPAALLIIVDDGSGDGTLAAARAAGDVVIRHRRNRGKGAALRSGIDAALRRGAAAVLTLDADGQHQPEVAGRLVAALSHADLVIGARDRAGGGMPWRRRVTNALATAAIGSITRCALADTQSGYRAIRRAVLERVQARGDRYDFETDFLIRAALAGYAIAAVPVPTIYGARSHFRPITDSAGVVRAIWRHRRREPD
jgi:glycosyltransferase involved in cell wall biosynthesis